MEEKRKQAALKRIEELRQAYGTRRQKGLSKTLLYGKWGTYKSTIATTMPRPILWHEFDPGGEKIKHVQDGIQDGSIIMDTKFSGRNLDEAGDLFAEWNKEYAQLKREGVFEYVKSYVVDSFTTLQRLIIDATIKSNPKNTPISEKLPFHVPYQRDYGVQDSAVEFMVSDMLDLPCHVMVIAHAEEGTDDNDFPYFQPMIVGKKLRGKIPMLFDEIYVAKVAGSKGQVLIEPQGMYEARSRLASLHDLPSRFSNEYPGDFNFTRDILVPVGYETADAVVDIADPADVEAAKKKRKRKRAG